MKLFLCETLAWWFVLTFFSSDLFESEWVIHLDVRSEFFFFKFFIILYLCSSLNPKQHKSLRPLYAEKTLVSEPEKTCLPSSPSSLAIFYFWTIFKRKNSEREMGKKIKRKREKA